MSPPTHPASGIPLRVLLRSELIFGAISPSFSGEADACASAPLQNELAFHVKSLQASIRTAWEKYLIDTSLNRISGVLMATYGQLNSNPHAHKLLSEAGGELLRLANACGIRLTDQALVNLFRLLASLPPEGKTSMLQDLEAGRKTEVEALAGEVVRFGREHGVGTPSSLHLFHMLRFLEQRGASFDPNCAETSHCIGVTDVTFFLQAGSTWRWTGACSRVKTSSLPSRQRSFPQPQRSNVIHSSRPSCVQETPPRKDRVPL